MSIKTELFQLKQKPIIQISIILSLFCACGDPGYQLRPVGWQPISDHEWKKQFDDFEIHSRGIRGLIGDRSVDPDLRIYNSTKSISLETADLLTATERFPAEIYGDKSIPASRDGYHFPVDWKFGNSGPAPKVLGGRCSIVLNLKIDGQTRQVKIEYEK